MTSSHPVSSPSPAPNSNRLASAASADLAGKGAQRTERPLEAVTPSNEVRTGSAMPRVLCVADDRNVLKGLQLQLERFYGVEIASSGAEALEKLAASAPFAVVMSGMLTPDMDGVTFLAHVCQRFNNSVRILITGHADLRTAAAAVNESEIFRFLVEPYPPDKLLATVGQAVQHHHLIVSERLLLDQTLRGSIQVLTDVLALTHPVAFGERCGCAGW